MKRHPGSEFVLELKFAEETDWFTVYWRGSRLSRFTSSASLCATYNRLAPGRQSTFLATFVLSAPSDLPKSFEASQKVRQVINKVGPLGG
jgi:hypothetical protein